LKVGTKEKRGLSTARPGVQKPNAGKNRAAPVEMTGVGGAAFKKTERTSQLGSGQAKKPGRSGRDDGFWVGRVEKVKEKSRFRIAQTTHDSE
jgi:hypothetical protein